MDHIAHPLDRHFSLPRIREVDAARPLHWLRLGWDDLRENAFSSIAYGVFFSFLGFLILAYASTRPYLITASISGFFLVGPLAAAGLYEISRRAGSGQDAGLAASLRGIGNRRESLFSIGIFLAFTLIAWERISAILFALLVPEGVAELDGFFRTVFLSGEHLGFVASYVLLGGLLAALVFALTVVAVPMLMDRETDLVTAMMTSLRAVQINPQAMTVWAGSIVVLVAIGFATLMIGLILLLPLLGHATWHAYRDLVE